MPGDSEFSHGDSSTSHAGSHNKPISSRHICASGTHEPGSQDQLTTHTAGEAIRQFLYKVKKRRGRSVGGQDGPGGKAGPLSGHNASLAGEEAWAGRWEDLGPWQRLGWGFTGVVAHDTGVVWLSDRGCRNSEGGKGDHSFGARQTRIHRSVQPSTSCFCFLRLAGARHGLGGNAGGWPLDLLRGHWDRNCRNREKNAEIAVRSHSRPLDEAARSCLRVSPDA